MDAAPLVGEVRDSKESVADRGYPAPKHHGSADHLTELEQEIVELHRLWRAGEICESTYHRTLQQLEAELAILSRAF